MRSIEDSRNGTLLATHERVSQSSSSLFLVDDSGRRGCAVLLSGNFREIKVMVVRTSPGTDR